MKAESLMARYGERAGRYLKHTKVLFNIGTFNLMVHLYNSLLKLIYFARKTTKTIITKLLVNNSSSPNKKRTLGYKNQVYGDDCNGGK